jgi:hypothetical protein
VRQLRGEEAARYIPHIQVSHPLDSAPYYSSLCHFFTTDKLQDNVTHYAKHIEASKNMADQGSYEQGNKDSIFLVEGSHYRKMTAKESHDVWASKLRKTIPNPI